jgi:hypothetical protein
VVARTEVNSPDQLFSDSRQSIAMYLLPPKDAMLKGQDSESPPTLTFSKEDFVGIHRQGPVQNRTALYDVVVLSDYLGFFEVSEEATGR